MGIMERGVGRRKGIMIERGGRKGKFRGEGVGMSVSGEGGWGKDRWINGERGRG